MEEGGSNSSGWKVCSKTVPKSQFVFLFQVVLIYIVVITSIVNLTIDKGEPKLWTALLCGNIGYLLPNPKPKRP